VKSDVKSDMKLSIELVSPAPVTIPPYSDMETQPGVAGAVAGVTNHVLLLGGGANFPDSVPWRGGKKVWYSALVVFEKNQTGVWVPRTESYELPTRIGYAASVSTPEGVAVLGGENENGRLNSAFLLRWNMSQKKVETVLLPSLPYACSNASAVWFQSKIFLCGGMTQDGASDRVFSLNLSAKTPEWVEEPRLPRPVAYAVLVRQNDGKSERLWLVGGRTVVPALGKKETEIGVETVTKTVFYDSLYSWRPGEREWTEHEPIQNAEGERKPLAAGTGVVAGTSGILLFGGDDGRIFDEREKMEQEIRRTENPERKAALEAEFTKMSEEHPGFDRTIYCFNTITGKWCVCGELPFKTPVTTTVLENGGTYIFTSGEVSPAIRTPFLHFLRLVETPHFSIINYGVFFLYMVLMLGIGLFFAAGNKTSEDFFHGGGRVPWWAVGISLFATMLSAITFLAIPAKAYAANWNMFFFNFGIALVAPIVVGFYLPKFRKISSISAYHFLEERFNRATRWFASGLFCVFMVSRIAIVLYLPAIAMNVVTGLDVHFCILVTGLITLVYSTVGGVKAVIWSDVIQGFILTGGAIISLIWLIVNTNGGISGFFQLGLDYQKFNMLDLSLSATSPVFWTVLVGGCVSQFITYTSDQTVIQRYFTTSNEREMIRSIWLNALVSIPITLIFFLIGTGLFTFYASHPELLSATLKPMDAIYPYFIVTSLPEGISGLLIVAVFAASMSTLSSNINSASAAICADFVRVFRPEITPRSEVTLARIAGVIVGLLGIGLACVLATWNIQSLWDQFNTFLGLFTGTLGALFFMGFFMKNVGGIGAVCGVLGSVTILFLIQKMTPITFLLYGLIEIVACCIIASLASLIFDRRS
ncbi:MAG: sodium/solute symporter, partial [Planctomycetia bacterium]|nr:sodium/solute symporter [Planctomycetia bacterium]